MNIFLNEYFGFCFELNFELNHFWAKFNEKMNFQNVSNRASGGINFALFFFHCRSGGKKERDGVLIFLVRVRVCWVFFHCRKIFSSSGKTILLLFFFHSRYGKRVSDLIVFLIF